MLTELHQYLSAHLPEDAIREVSRLAVPMSLRRNDQVLTAGEVCRHKIFIVRGLLRSFTLTEDGNEHILQFSPAGTWTLDVESYDRSLPSQISIAAIEASAVLLWQKPDFDDLLLRIPELKRFSEQLISRNIYSSRNRILTMLSGTPEEKYDDFVRSYPDFLGRLPLRMIASYLGISLKTLTRIRHAQLHR